MREVLKVEQDKVRDSADKAGAIRSLTGRWAAPPSQILEQGRRWVRGVGVPLKFLRGFLDALHSEFVDFSAAATLNFFEKNAVPDDVGEVLRAEQDAVQRSARVAIEALVSRWGSPSQALEQDRRWIR